MKTVDDYMIECLAKIHSLDLPISLTGVEADKRLAMCGLLRALILDACMNGLILAKFEMHDIMVIGADIAQKLSVKLNDLIAAEIDKKVAASN